ncbi:hypothetical protein C0J52_08041 [Blattella germanica]|nr:hypothetical protein C0J52_08041 [Blattella germanica]
MTRESISSDEIIRILMNEDEANGDDIFEEECSDDDFVEEDDAANDEVDVESVVDSENESEIIVTESKTSGKRKRVGCNGNAQALKKGKKSDNCWFTQEGTIVTPKKRILIGKNGHTWHSEPPPLGKTPERNIVMRMPGPKRAAKEAISERQCWNLFLNSDMMTIVVKNTNEEIARQRQNYSSAQSFTGDTCTEEMHAYFGILITSAALKDNHLSVEDMWNNFYGKPIYRAAMSKERFRFLTNCMRFDDKNTRDARKASDPFAAIRDITDMFASNCQEMYTPSTCCTIDEQLLAFRGRCPFRIYIPNKPAKYGIKLVMLCDSKTFYAVNIIPYVGKATHNGDIPLADYFVKKLSKPIHGTNRNITTDNWFTSVSLGSSLLEDYKLTTVGTLRKNKKEIPPEMTMVSGRKLETSLFIFDDKKTMTSFYPKKNKMVLLLSTMHQGKYVIPETKKPEIIEFYNKTKGGVDTMDQLCNTYSCSRKTRRWPLCVFYGLMNIAGVNAAVIYNTNMAVKGREIIPRKTFLLRLGRELVIPWIEARSVKPTLQSKVRQVISEVLGLENTQKDNSNVNQQVNSGKKAGRCSVCPRKNDRKTTVKCDKCKEFVCNAHKISLCQKCK